MDTKSYCTEYEILGGEFRVVRALGIPAILLGRSHNPTSHHSMVPNVMDTLCGFQQDGSLSLPWPTLLLYST